MPQALVRQKGITIERDIHLPQYRTLHLVSDYMFKVWKLILLQAEPHSKKAIPSSSSQLQSGFGTWACESQQVAKGSCLVNHAIQSFPSKTILPNLVHQDKSNCPVTMISKSQCREQTPLLHAAHISLCLRLSIWVYLQPAHLKTAR